MNPLPGHYQDIYDEVALPILVLDSESWDVVAANSAACELYGYSREEFIGLPVLEIRPPDGRADALRVLSEMPHGFWKTTAVFHQRKDGSIFRADVWARDTKIEGKSVRVCTISDVTERVALQQELQQAQKMEAVGRLAGGIAHDFNNVLTSIIGGVELLVDRVADDPEARGDLEEIRRAAERASDLTRNLLAFARRQPMRIEAVELPEVFEEVRGLVARVLGSGVELRTDFDGETWTVEVDPNQFEQVLLNLAINARDAMPDGGAFTVVMGNVTLDESEDDSETLIPAGDYVEVILTDTGTGMDDETRSRIFEPFFTTKAWPAGTGLGLAMVHGIVRQSRGFVTVDTEVGRGTSFRILLPRA